MITSEDSKVRIFEGTEIVNKYKGMNLVRLPSYCFSEFILLANLPITISGPRLKGVKFLIGSIIKKMISYDVNIAAIGL